MMAFPEPVIEEHEGILVVRDDLIPGGTKRRVIDSLMIGADTFVYASPAYGYAQIALAHACRDLGKRAVIFTAQRKELHQRTQEAIQAGAEVIMVPYGYMSVVRKRAAEYAAEHHARNLPFGFDTPAFLDALTIAIRTVQASPDQVWCVAGSGTLSRALQRAWPDADHHAVQVGSVPNAGRATVHQAPERFEQDAKEPPPFPSTSNYDAKVWRFIREHARPGALFWNVAG
jgi:hypothetical protein